MPPAARQWLRIAMAPPALAAGTRPAAADPADGILSLSIARSEAEVESGALPRRGGDLSMVEFQFQTAGHAGSIRVTLPRAEGIRPQGDNEAQK
jgi:hypothetical protein